MTEHPKELKSTHRAVQILLKEVLSTKTWLNPNMFEFVAWNPGGYVVLTIEGKERTPARNLFISRSVYVNNVKDLSMDQWRNECGMTVRELFLISQSKDIW